MFPLPADGSHYGTRRCEQVIVTTSCCPFSWIDTGIDVRLIVFHQLDFIIPMVNVPFDIMAAQICGEGAYKSVPIPYLQPPLRWSENSMPIQSHLLNVIRRYPTSDRLRPQHSCFKAQCD
jgi:hypothetical protein